MASTATSLTIQTIAQISTRLVTNYPPKIISHGRSKCYHSLKAPKSTVLSSDGNKINSLRALSQPA
ncbi:hypothetical protein COLO4_15566 [Corchorus olitorius]|uniref:Uncharacterized protein n=1 Tax=Corchorus olitorius TaxID=93759 RepID=A0A1R3JMB5_9ROSI|nr:hypothetical protein COLO4_15566 [Corchorus olitorius]